MRAILSFTEAVALLVFVGGAVVPLSPGQAADTPNADQIIHSLTPAPAGTGTPLTRGIRMGGQPPMAGKPGMDAGAAAGSIVPMKPPEANLTVPFASGSAMISPFAARVLDQLGMALTSPKLADYKFRVEGHTDTVGSPEMNKILSEQRAASVAEYLTARFGIDPSRLTPVGMGEEGLLIETGPDVPSAANRRVLVVNLGR